MKDRLLGKTFDELAQVALEAGMPRYAAAQMAAWLYKKGVGEITQMSDISLRNRELLSERYEVGAVLPESVAESADGTKKYLFQTISGHFIESAYIPDGDRATLCVSSQAGCKMGCLFCMTGRQGFQHNLTANEIINQARSIPESAKLTNIVYMGMGEPLDNTGEVIKSIEILTSEWGFGWSPTRITLSTIGITGGLSEALERTRVHIAVSLHNPFPEERAEMMPVEKAYPIDKVIALLRRYDFSSQRRISFEYIVFKGINDTAEHVHGLARLLNGLNCRINLIRFHAIPGSPYESPDDLSMVRFRDALSKKGIVTTVRTSRGEDIQAACGLLSTKNR